MGGRSDLDWSAISKEEDPVRGDCEAMDDAVSRLQECIDVLENVCMLSSRLTNAHANFVGDAACSFDQGIRDSADLSQSLGEICEQVRSSLYTWSTWVEQYQSEADPKCREGMQIKATIDSLQQDLDQANADLKERQFALSHERQRQRAMTAQGIDIDAESKRRLNSLESKTDDAQSHADGLQRRIDWRKDRLRELHNQVTEIEEQYQADGKRITASLEALIGELIGYIGELASYGDVESAILDGVVAGKAVMAVHGEHRSFSWRQMLKELTTRPTPERKRTTSSPSLGSVARQAGHDFLKGGKDAIKGSVIGGIMDGVSTYGDRVDQYGEAAALEDGVAHGTLGIIGGAIGSAAGASVQAVFTLIPGGGVIIGPAVGTAVGTTTSWRVTAFLDGAYDTYVRRGAGDDFNSHYQDNKPFSNDWKDDD